MLHAVSERLEAVARAARDWRDPEHPPRADAVERTLDAPNRFTEKALAFAVNAAAHGLTPDRLRDWMGDRQAAQARTVAVAPAGETPLSGLRAVLAVGLAGHRCRLVRPEASPALVPAFIEAVEQEEEGERFFTATECAEAAFDEADAAIGAAGGLGGSEDENDAQAAFARRCEANGIPPERRWWRAASCSVAVLDGNESEEARDGLAEDALLDEGGGPAGVRLVWAPAGTAPDRYFEAMARFRAVFPAHPDTPGALQMQQAFLDARDQSHAHGEGLEFLVSRGAPEVQPGAGHLRWAEYDALADVEAWLETHADRVHAVVARLPLAGRIAASFPAREPGVVHRQFLEAPGAEEPARFAAEL
jgi:hypothetical protein